MKAKDKRKLNYFENIQKKKFLASKELIQLSKEFIGSVNELYKNEYSQLKDNFVFSLIYPLEMLVDIADSIEKKSIILKDNYLGSIEKNDYISSSILIRSDLELTYFYYYLISKSLDYLKNKNWIDLTRLLLRINMGKSKNSPFDNRIVDLLKTGFRDEFSNIDKKIHINDVIKYLNKENSKQFKLKVLEILLEDSFILQNDKIISKKQNKIVERGSLLNDIHWQKTIDHYGSLSEIVHPTAFFLINKLSSFDPYTNKELNFIDLKKFNFDGDLSEKIESISTCMGLLNNLHILKEIIINIYIFYHNDFEKNKKDILNSLGLKLLKQTNDILELENIKTKDILRLSKNNDKKFI
tara:strand:- start:830 stop:1891 length:1062 start_codon:yes stop_codon:yes gene_type:complete